MKCFHPMCCVTSPLFRVNAKGQPGVWACREHMKNTDARIPAEVDELVKVVESARGAK